MFGFPIISRPGLPILPTFGVDPNVVRIERRLRSGGRSDPLDGRIRTEIQFIRFDPVCGDGLLGCFQVEPPTANQLMELAFQSVFNLGVPRRGPV